MKHDLQAGAPIDLTVEGGRSEAHVFKEEDIRAIEAAYLTGRPLLLKGEPGVGKSQFARAAAKGSGRNFRSKVVDATTQSRDLLWDTDLIERLAQAQALGAGGRKADTDVENQLDIRRFVKPGVLWWGFNPGEAAKHITKFRETETGPAPDEESPKGLSGMVVLIDEIDKAESDVPNGLLEALGDRRFTPDGYSEPIDAVDSPLVIITTNEERPLPPAFLRRCIVHQLTLGEGNELRNLLIERGRAHFPDQADKYADIIAEAAELTLKDRERADQQNLRPLPGQAEFIDLLYAMFAEDQLQRRSPVETLVELSPYILRKHSELHE